MNNVPVKLFEKFFRNISAVISLFVMLGIITYVSGLIERPELKGASVMLMMF